MILVCFDYVVLFLVVKAVVLIIQSIFPIKFPDSDV